MNDKTPKISDYENNIILSGISCWDDYTNSDPLEIFHEVFTLLAVDLVTLEINISPDVFRLLIGHPSVEARHKLNNVLEYLSVIKYWKNFVEIVNTKTGEKYAIKPLSS